MYVHCHKHLIGLAAIATLAEPPAFVPVFTLEQINLINQAFISHTGRDNDTFESSSLASAINGILTSKRLASFFDARTLGCGVLWDRKIQVCVKCSKVFVALFSPNFPLRYWCMHELDIAINEPPALGRVIIPILLGDDSLRRSLEDPPDAWVKAWVGMKAQHPNEVDIGRWKQNLLTVLMFQALTAGKPAKGDTQKLAETVANIVAGHIF
jgi:hypothetical protein